MNSPREKNTPESKKASRGVSCKPRKNARGRLKGMAAFQTEIDLPSDVVVWEVSPNLEPPIKNRMAMTSKFYYEALKGKEIYPTYFAKKNDEMMNILKETYRVSTATKLNNLFEIAKSRNDMFVPILIITSSLSSRLVRCIETDQINYKRQFIEVRKTILSKALKDMRQYINRRLFDIPWVLKKTYLENKFSKPTKHVQKWCEQMGINYKTLVETGYDVKVVYASTNLNRLKHAVYTYWNRYGFGYLILEIYTDCVMNNTPPDQNLVHQDFSGS